MTSFENNSPALESYNDYGQSLYEQEQAALEQEVEQQGEL